MTKDVLLAFSLFALVSSITPGPNNAMLLASGVNFGLRRSLPHMLGVTVGFGVLVLCAGLGLQGILSAVPILYRVIRWAGAAYLLYLAWKIATAGEAAEKQAGAKPFSFLQAVAFQWVNPKAVVSAISAVTTYAVTHSFSEVLVITAVFAVITLPVTLVWTSGGVALRRLLHDPRKRRVFNVTMALLLVLSLYPLLL